MSWQSIRRNGRRSPRTRNRSRAIPPGAHRQALDRPLERGGGPPGSAAGPRHAADDSGSENRGVWPTDTTRTPASPPIEDEDRLEKGPPFAGLSGGAVAALAQLRSSEGTPEQIAELEHAETAHRRPLLRRTQTRRATPRIASAARRQLNTRRSKDCRSTSTRIR